MSKKRSLKPHSWKIWGWVSYLLLLFVLGLDWEVKGSHYAEAWLVAGVIAGVLIWGRK